MTARRHEQARMSSILPRGVSRRIGRLVERVLPLGEHPDRALIERWGKRHAAHLVEVRAAEVDEGRGEEMRALGDGE